MCSYTGNQRAQTWCTNGRCKCTLIFADDVIISDTKENVQNLLNVTAHWCTSWKLCVNMEKTKVVHSRNSRSSCTATPTGPAVATCRSTSDNSVICIKGCQTWLVPREVPSSHATMTSELPTITLLHSGNSCAAAHLPATRATIKKTIKVYQWDGGLNITLLLVIIIEMPHPHIQFRQKGHSIHPQAHCSRVLHDSNVNHTQPGQFLHLLQINSIYRCLSAGL